MCVCIYVYVCVCMPYARLGNGLLLPPNVIHVLCAYVLLLEVVYVCVCVCVCVHTIGTLRKKWAVASPNVYVATCVVCICSY